MREAGSRRAPRSRRRTVRRVGLIALAVGVLAIVGGIVWAANPMRAEAGPLAAVQADRGIEYRDAGDAVVLTPASPNGTGLVFLAGARVDAAAYAATFRGLADAGTAVVIVRPPLDFAILETRPLRDFEALAPASVTRWAVGGHSLGGVRACGYAADGGVSALVLLGSYCAVDLSGDDLPVLSLGGARDGLSTPQKIAGARHLLPASARLVQIPGAVHAQFGAYGDQPGDGVPTASDAAVRRAVTADLVAFFRDSADRPPPPPPPAGAGT